MALDKITDNEIYGGSGQPFDAVIKNIDDVLAALAKLKLDAKEVLTTIATELRQIKPNNIKNIGSQDDLIGKSKQYRTLLNDLTKEEIRLQKEKEKTLQAAAEIDKEYLKVQQAKHKEYVELLKVEQQRIEYSKQESKLTQQKNKDQQQTIKNQKDINRLEKDNLGTLERAKIENRVLRQEREKLNTATAWGAQRLKEINAQIDKNTELMKRNGDAAEKQRSKIGDYFGAITKAFAMFGAGFMALQQAWERFKIVAEFEKQISNLKALTGLVGYDLNVLKNASIDLSKQFGISAKDIVEGMKLIGGAKPELLSNAEALKQVTEQALILSKASGMDLPEAAKRLTDAMNQFDLPATEAAKTIDTLAAGAKYGSAEIPDITDALLEFGSVAKDSNISLSQSVALIETLGSKGVKSGKAGTGLRNLILIMDTIKSASKEAQVELAKNGINLDLVADKTKPLSERLKELSKITESSTALAALFGKENINVGKIILTNIPMFEKLSEQVLETGSAIQQMNDNTDNLSSDIDKLGTSFDALTLKGSAFSNVLRSIVQLATNGIEKVSELANNLQNIFTKDNIVDKLKSYTNTFINWADIVTFGSMTSMGKAFGTKIGFDLDAQGNQLKAVIKIKKDNVDVNNDLTESTKELTKSQEKEKKILEALLKAEADLYRLRVSSGALWGETRKKDIAKDIVQPIKPISGQMQTNTALPDVVLTKTLADYESDYQNFLANMDQNSFDSLMEMYEKERELLDQQYKYKMLSANEYNKAVNENRENQMQLENRYYSEVASEASNLFGFLGSLYEENTQERKIFASIQATIDSFAAANAALLSGSYINPIAGIIAAGTALATGLVNVAKINDLSFKDGVIDFQGKGNGTSDSNVVRISHGESVVTALGTDLAPKALEMINSGMLSDAEIFNQRNIAFNYEQKELANEMKKANSYLSKLGYTYEDNSFIYIIQSNGNTTKIPKKK